MTHPNPHTDERSAAQPFDKLEWRLIGPFRGGRVVSPGRVINVEQTDPSSDLDPLSADAIQRSALRIEAFEQMDNRVGPITARVELAAPTDIPLSAVEALAAAQSTCLTVGARPNPTFVPVELLADD